MADDVIFVEPGEPVVDATPSVDTDNDNQYNNQQDDLTIEQARKDGWVPQEEWKGDPKRWVDAKTFTERAEITRPLRDKIHRIEREWSEERKKTLQAMRDLDEMRRQQYDARVAELEAKKKTAFEAGDYATFESAERARREAEQAISPAANSDVDHEAVRYAEEFKRDNPWFERDADSTARARDYVAGKMQRLHSTGMVTPQAFGEVLREAAELFGPKASAPKPPPVASGGGRPAPAPNKSAKKFSELSESERNVFHAYARRGIYKDTDAGRERFVRDLEDSSPWVAS